MSLEYWCTCALDPWPALESDEAFGEIVDALRTDGEYEYDAVMLTLQEAPPSFVPIGNVVVHVVGSPSADWDEVMEFLDAMAAAGDGVVFSEDRQVVLDRRSVRPGVKAFNERPTWAVLLGKTWPDLTVVVEGTKAVADPSAELGRVGLAGLAGRVTVTATGTKLHIRATQPSDALVAGQVLGHAARGRAWALGPDGLRQELPR
jgi:hypothetical protein